MIDPKTNSAFDRHEDVVFVGDEQLGYAGIIAIHNTALGPAAGGCRIWTYAKVEDALTDALRLSRGMTYKNAMADLPLGGGKAVIYKMGADRAACFEAFGRDVEALGGRYITAEDVGASVADMRAIARTTSYVAGLPTEEGQAGGDPSPVTALGVFVSIKALLGGSVQGRTITVQGVGSVGFNLCKLLGDEGAKFIIADVNEKNLERAKALGAEIAAPDRIHAVKADLFSPCALGAGLNTRTIPELGAPIVCGAANNQLETEEDGARLVARGITYAPDYVVNAGGIINVSAEYLGEPADVVDARVRAIATRLTHVLDVAKAENIPPHQAADRIVRERIAAAKKN
ncbi:MAG TPA: Glu/Leu/Phe/Val dehydrogenase dimerization domain-containing protein [Vitreimonas sp.]|uniref:Leu/Phe/Val dehydrogenase n=1 Tax=Vitreimonas sp. TaxID=3069702 RepID=UPI002D3FF9F3|nr:Glu/Leu/Phe/Val dehydrogenase dimerization domain-containing protein [Vitreimonas sp.]HYD87183.1 Glu/Leu/Phe/Val dehydrogenase dimerization domain-containing protein [Vitreimonas sp.]